MPLFSSFTVPFFSLGIVLIPGAIILSPLMDSALLVKEPGSFVQIGSGQEKSAIAAWLLVLVILI